MYGVGLVLKILRDSAAWGASTIALWGNEVMQIFVGITVAVRKTM